MRRQGWASRGLHVCKIRWVLRYLPTSPHISPHLPTSAHISPHLPTSAHISHICPHLPPCTSFTYLPPPLIEQVVTDKNSQRWMLMTVRSLHTSLGRPPLLTSLGDTWQVLRRLWSQPKAWTALQRLAAVEAGDAAGGSAPAEGDTAPTEGAAAAEGAADFGEFATTLVKENIFLLDDALGRLTDVKSKEVRNHLPRSPRLFISPDLPPLSVRASPSRRPASPASHCPIPSGREGGRGRVGGPTEKAA